MPIFDLAEAVVVSMIVNWLNDPKRKSFVFKKLKISDISREFEISADKQPFIENDFVSIKLDISRKLTTAFQKENKIPEHDRQSAITDIQCLFQHQIFLDMLQESPHLDAEAVFQAAKTQLAPLFPLQGENRYLFYKQLFFYCLTIYRSGLSNLSRYDTTMLRQIYDKHDSVKNEIIDAIHIVEMRSDNRAYEIFRSAMILNTRSQDIAGISPLFSNLFDVTEIFVPLELSLETPKSPEEMPDFNLLDYHLIKFQRCVLYGQPGSGKTTLLRWLTLTVLEGNLPKKTSYLSSLMPIFIQAREIRFSHAKSLFDVITLALPNSGSPDIQALIQARISAGEALVIIDGLDEVAENDRTVLMRWTEVFIKEYPKCYYCLSSRPYARIHEFEETLQFEVVKIKEIDREKQKLLVDQLFNYMVNREKLRKPLLDRALRKAAWIKEQIDFSPSMSNLCRFPLLLAMVCTLSIRPSSNLMDTRFSIFEEIIRALIYDRDLSRDMHLPIEQLEWTIEKFSMNMFRILRNVANAIRVQSSEYDTYDENFIDIQIRDTLDLEGSPHKVEIIRQYLVNRSGILAEVGGKGYDFRFHLFRDFFVGEDLGRKRLYRPIVERTDLDWFDITQFFFGKLNKDFQDDDYSAKNTLIEVYRELLDKQCRLANSLNSQSHGSSVDWSELQSLEMSLVASREVVEIDKLPGAIAKDIEHIAISNLPPRTTLQVKSLASAGDAIIPNLVDLFTEESLDDEIFRNCLEVIARIGTGLSLEALSKVYRDCDDSQKIQWILDIWPYFQEDEFSQNVLKMRKCMKDVKWPGVRSLSAVGMFDGIERFFAHGRVDLHSWEPLSAHGGSLRELSISFERSIRSLDDLPGLPHLRDLIIRYSPSFSSISGIEKFPNLTNLVFEGCNELVFDNFNVPIKNLENFGLINCHKATSVDFLSLAEKVEDVDFSGSSKISDCEKMLSQLPNLARVYCWDSGVSPRLLREFNSDIEVVEENTVVGLFHD